MNLLELNMVSAFDIDLKFQFNPSGATCLHSCYGYLRRTSIVWLTAI